jgi:aminoglycoside 2'-N-acetyltransferase I
MVNGRLGPPPQRPGVERTREDDGCSYVLPVEVQLDLFSELTCDWRDGDP